MLLRCSALLLLCSACGQSADRPPAAGLDCAATEDLELLNISDFEGSDSGWFQFADPTPGGTPNPAVDGSNVPVSAIDAPGRCGSENALHFVAEGHNFWGVGFGDWAHNQAASRADGTGYTGIMFWARAARSSEKQFLLGIDDGRTILFPPPAQEDGSPPLATAADQDLNGDGFIGAGDIVAGTRCRLPPSDDLGKVSCYNNVSSGPPSGGVRVPDADECGNAFHVRITLGETWQPYFIPWRDLVQWPCPNRLAGGIDPADIAKLEIKLVQGTRYDLWIDDIAFYR